MTESSSTKGTKSWFWLGLLSSWICFLLFFTQFIGFLIWGGALFVLIHRKSPLRWNLLAFSPWLLVPLLSMTFATANYFQGEASLKYTGMPSQEFYNLDPESRSWKQTSGCLIIGYEFFTHSPNNAMVKLWTRLLGPQRGVYQGIYPDKRETEELLATQASSLIFKKGIKGSTFQLDGKTFLIEEYQYHPQEDLSLDKIAHVLFLNKELIIFKALDQKSFPITYLIDYKSGKIFARYRDDPAGPNF